MATIAALAGAAVGAYGAYTNSKAQKDAAKAGAKGYTNQTTTQTPYGNEWFNDPNGGDLQNLMNLQRGLIEKGPTYLGGSGPAGAGGGGGSAAGAAKGGAVPAGYHVNKAGKVVPVKNAGSGTTAGPAGQSAINYRDPTSIGAAVAQAGLNAGKDPTTQAAQKGVQNILSGQGGAGSGTGYQGFNPINDALAQQLQGKVSADDSAALVRQFISGGGGPAGGSASGWDPYAGGGGGGYYGPNASAIASDKQMVAGGGPADSTQGGGTFNDTVKRLLAQGVDEKSIQAIVDQQNADIEKSIQDANWGIDAQAQGTGRLGGDTWKGLMNDQAYQARKAMASSDAQTRLAGQKQWMDLQEGLLGQVNARDIASMNDATQRYGISTSASVAGAGNASAAANARRGQDLQALGMLMDNSQFNTGQLSGLGNALTQAQLGAIGEAPGLAGIGLSGLGAANQAAGNDVSLRQAQIGASTARAGLNQQAQIYNANAAQQQVNDYLRTIMGVGSLGGSTHTEGTNVQPIPYAGSTSGATIAGALGGAATGYGLYNQYQAGR